MRRWLAVVVAAVLLSGTLPAHAAKKLDPKVVNLRLTDMPTGFVLTSGAYYSNAELARVTKASLQTVTASGRLSSYEARYRSVGTADLLFANGVTELFTSSGAASREYKAVLTTPYLAQFAPMSIARIGTQIRAWIATAKVNGVLADLYLAEFTRGPYAVALEIAIRKDTLSPETLARFARIIDGRIRAQIK